MLLRAASSYIVGTGIAAAGLAGLRVYSTGAESGRAKCRAEIAEQTAVLQARLDDVSAERRAAELALKRAQQDRTDLERRLADEVMDDPMADDPGLAFDSLRRLDRIGRPGKAAN